jgi:hypothetical protein
VPTGLSSTKAASAAATHQSPGQVARARRAVEDLGHLVRFRAGTVRRRSAIPITVGVMTTLTLAACTLPMLLPGARDSTRARDVLLLLPTAFAAFLMLTIVSGVASGGGRELLSREQGVAFPVSPTTDHLGALLMAPLNIAWLIQAWALLGIVAYALPVADVPAAVASILLWLAACTALAQVVAWTMEAIRRRKYGRAVVRGLGLSAGAAVAWVQISGRLGETLDQLPTLWVVARGTRGFGGAWVEGIAFEIALLVVAVVVGAVPVHIAAKVPPRDEARVESGMYPVRRMPASVIGTLVSLDRNSVWRAVPMRRGITVLGVGPGLVAIAGGMSWPSMTILPGLVASGGALLFGVNAWCLDGRGLLWRESLPARADQVFAARALVLAEFVLVASTVTVVLAALRAGLPTSYELAAMVCLVLVVTVQVIGAAMRWSAQRPFPVDMRSARATPAPPVVMVGYSTRLALSTTFTGLFFSVLARVPEWRLPVLLAMPFLAWSGYRLWRTSKVWEDPVERARVVMAVAA